ncbi:concanavalin A-like lectin/glucanase [Tanacetum coccineum]
MASTQTCATQCPYEHALYIKQFENRVLVAALYVDDLIFTGNNKLMIDQFKESMTREFEMTDLGLMKYFLGSEVRQEICGIFISQTAYAKEILKKSKMENSNPVVTPMNWVPNFLSLRKENQWMQTYIKVWNLLRELKNQQDGPTEIKVDNKEQIRNREVRLNHVMSRDEAADIFTKALPAELFNICKQKMGMKDARDLSLRKEFPEVSHRPFMGEVVQALKLVYNECEETRDLGSRTCSQEDLTSLDFDPRVSTNSGYGPDPCPSHSTYPSYESPLDVESRFSGLGLDVHSYRITSSSGPLRPRRRLQIWEKMKRFSSGTNVVISDDFGTFGSASLITTKYHEVNGPKSPHTGTPKHLKRNFLTEREVMASGESVMSTSTHPIIILSDFDVEDAFSCTDTSDYTPTSPNYSPATPGNTSSNSENESDPLEDPSKNHSAPLSITPFPDDPYMHIRLAYYATNEKSSDSSFSSTIPPPPTPVYPRKKA